LRLIGNLESYRILDNKFYVDEFHFHRVSDINRTAEWTDAIYIANHLAYLSEEQINTVNFDLS